MKRVLLVDDEANMRKLLTAVLKKQGWEVIEARNAAEALAAAEKNEIDVLVTDVVMDDMDGIALARRMVERNALLPVIFISGYPMELEAERERHAECTFLLKPFTPKSLVAAIEGFEARRRPGME